MTYPRRILLIQLRRIGDVLMCTPALRVLREKFPQSHITFLVEKECAGVLKLNPYLNQIISLDRGKYRNPLYWLETIWKLRRGDFDLSIDFLGNPRTAYISLLSGARKRVGYDTPRRRLFYNVPVKDDATGKYSATHKLGMLRFLGIEREDVHLDFLVSDEARLFSQRFFQESGISRDKLTVSLSPTSRRHFNRWPLERYARLADWLISEFKATVILVWGPGERETVEKIKVLMTAAPLISWETQDLLQLGGVLEKCDLHIGNDNGTKHIAVAMGKPTITIYGPHDPRSWTYPDPSRHRFLKAQVDCPDCDKIKHKCSELDCLQRIGVEDVQEVFLQLLSDLKKNQEKGFLRKIEHTAAN